MASTKKAVKPTFKEKWDEDLKWYFISGVFTVPACIVAIAFGISVINLYVGWF